MTNKFKKGAIVAIAINCILFNSYITHSEEKYIPPSYDEVLNADLKTLSADEFYNYELVVISGHSGSGGYFLDEEATGWLLKAEEVFKERGIKLKDDYRRQYVIAWSYYNNGAYDKALRKFKDVDEQYGVELTEWMINNEGITNGVLKIRSYEGKPPLEEEEVKAESERYLFTGHYKGPVYRYDKQENQHALIFIDDFKYNWCIGLEYENEKLAIKLRFDNDTFVYNNGENTIKELG